MDKHGKPKKFVLVKYGHSDRVFVILRETWEIYSHALRQTGGQPSVLVAESNDRDELERFKALTEED